MKNMRKKSYFHSRIWQDFVLFGCLEGKAHFSRNKMHEEELKKIVFSTFLSIAIKTTRTFDVDKTLKAFKMYATETHFLILLFILMTFKWKFFIVF